MLLRGRHVLLTGATGAIGQRLAEGLAVRGALATLVARSEEDLSRLAERVGGRSFAADLTDRAARDDLVPRVEAGHGPVDVVVHNAGVETAGLLVDLGPDDVERTSALNLVAPLDLTRALLPGMLERGRGHVVMVSSLAGVASFPGLAVYGATKAGLTQASAALATELRGTGVRTTVAELGPVASPMMDRVREHPTVAASFARARLLRVLRDLDPDEAARAVLDAVEADRSVVRRPRRAAPLALLPAAPRRLVGTVLRGVPVVRAGERPDGTAARRAGSDA
ncbi:SDR family NAD(P)-dependent oxidoreductase [Phycicoccus sp. BSK3Z-2]|uniref:SDR family NAD(P)-dependent oxidoreductase n=1 Tax=Phycicoccus avicenniae TaxID=2828860 RepID=A0A941D7H3_9MICO|nr:SDR family NAD(P)-dependent oxidoreductase [Phycicoccus avicenniae]MBR7742533.1 SDR family NAD(P)-dependent oxidoreductase [Phycicoccus avicenniae]